MVNVLGTLRSLTQDGHQKTLLDQCGEQKPEDDGLPPPQLMFDGFLLSG